MSTFRTRWRREQFDPSWLGLLANPFYFARRALLQELRPRLARLTGEVLDVGCGQKPYRTWIPATRYIGIDVDTPATRAYAAADVFYDGQRIPFPDDAFDAVLCSQVLEHVFTPADFLAEIHRVLRPSGQLLLTVPFVWDEHEQPHDFARYSSFGLRAVLERAGFTVTEHIKTNADFRCVVQLASGWMFKASRSQSRILNLLSQLALIAPINLAGGLLSALLPGNPDLYLDNVITARKPALSA